MSAMAAQWQAIMTALGNAERAANRAPGTVKLLAVSKTQPASAITEAAACGQRHFGENYLQETLQKQPQLVGVDVVWHHIGPIQSNKTRDIATACDWVHSLDRLKIAERLALQRPASLGLLPVLVQVNIDREPQKAGVFPENCLALLREIQALPNLALCGLMAIPEAPGDDPNATRPAFAALRKLRDDLQQGLGIALPELSMGMSQDYAAAIAEGATWVRIGSALFGARNRQ